VEELPKAIPYQNSGKMEEKVNDDDKEASANLATVQLQVKSKMWAKTLLDHKELTTGDKMLIPKFFKTEKEVTSLIDFIGEQASSEEDVSYIQVSSDLVAEILEMYPDYFS
jgi:hypothetical protein